MRWRGNPTVALTLSDSLVWVSYVPLLPLALLFFTGLYLFALPYRARRRGQQDAAGTP